MDKVTYPKLRGRMAERGYTIKYIADIIGITAQALSNKLNGRSGFSMLEVWKICDMLDIPRENAPIFFAEGV